MYEASEVSERGQVGIGSLISFVAMVLVAAIAAGVLIETAGILQAESEDTGEQSRQQVTNRLQFLSAIGEYTSGSMSDTELTVNRARRSGDFDLGEIGLHWVGIDGSATLAYRIIPVKGDKPILDNSTKVLQLVELSVSLGGDESATIRFVTASGGETKVGLRAPDDPPDHGTAEL